MELTRGAQMFRQLPIRRPQPRVAELVLKQANAERSALPFRHAERAQTFSLRRRGRRS